MVSDGCIFAHKHAKTLHGRTGTSRQLNRYAHGLPEETPMHLKKLLHGREAEKIAAALDIGRGMVNRASCSPTG